jgi:hypothetical protein
MQAQEGDAQDLDAASSCEGVVNRRRCSRAREGGTALRDGACESTCLLRAGGGGALGQWGTYFGRGIALGVVGGTWYKGLESEHPRAAAAPNTAQRIGPCFARDQADRKLLSQTTRGLPGEWRPHAPGRRRRRRRDRRVQVKRSLEWLQRGRPWPSEWQDLVAGHQGRRGPAGRGLSS